MKNMFILSFILFLLSSSVCGQTAKEQMPLIGEDRSVTFKYRNSEEKNVIVEGSFTEAKNMALIDRTWILHVDSLPSEMYTYSFYDGKYVSKEISAHTGWQTDKISNDKIVR